jgi:hypothetical protein
LENILDRALDALLTELEKKKLGKATGPRKARSTKPTKQGSVSRAARREAFERDGEQCSWVDDEGRRCEARAFLEIDHVDPRGRGGRWSTTWACQAHNGSGRADVRSEHVEKSIDWRWNKCGRGRWRVPMRRTQARVVPDYAGLARFVRAVVERLRDGGWYRRMRRFRSVTRALLRAI